MYRAKEPRDSINIDRTDHREHSPQQDRKPDRKSHIDLEYAAKLRSIGLWLVTSAA